MSNVWIKSLLDAVGITVAQVYVNTAQLEFVLLVNFNEKYTKCLLLLVEVKTADIKVNATISTASAMLVLLVLQDNLKSVEERLKLFKTNESIYLEDIKVLKVEIQIKDIAIRELRKKLEIAQKEKDDIQLTVDKLENAPKSINKLIECQIIDNSKKVLGYENHNAVPPPYIGNFMPPTPDLSYTGLDEFVDKPVAALLTDTKPDFINTALGTMFFLALGQIQVSDGLGPQKKQIFLPYVQSNPQMDLHDKGVIDSKCSKHVTENMSYLTNYKEIDEGYVAFGGNPKGGKIKGKD
nr:hypothetical protein [Tanacetum cinerariifolium]